MQYSAKRALSMWHSNWEPIICRLYLFSLTICLSPAVTLETNCSFHDRRCDWHLMLRHEIKTERRNTACWLSAAWVTWGQYVCTAAQIGDGCIGSSIDVRMKWSKIVTWLHTTLRDTHTIKTITDHLLMSVQRQKSCIHVAFIVTAD